MLVLEYGTLNQKPNPGESFVRGRINIRREWEKENDNNLNAILSLIFISHYMPCFPHEKF